MKNNKDLMSDIPSVVINNWCRLHLSPTYNILKEEWNGLDETVKTNMTVIYKDGKFIDRDSPYSILNGPTLIDAKITKVGEDGKVVKNENVINEFLNLAVEAEVNEAMDNIEPIKPILSDYCDDYYKYISDKTNDTILTPYEYTYLTSTGKGSKIIAPHSAKVISSAPLTKIISNGFKSNITMDGFASMVISGGDGATIVSNAMMNYIYSCGNNANIMVSDMTVAVLSTGNDATIYSSANGVKIDSRGEKANIICTGYCSRFRARVGSWATLTEFGQNTHKMKGIVRKYVDGIEIKGDTWYTVQDGGFVEIDKDDYKYV